MFHIAQDTDSTNPLIPFWLREALTESSPFLLGYRLNDWDFHTLFRGLIVKRNELRRSFGLAIQLDPSEWEGVVDEQEVRCYLKKYFEFSKFRVSWNTVDGFIQKLWQDWDQSR